MAMPSSSPLLLPASLDSQISPPKPASPFPKVSSTEPASPLPDSAPTFLDNLQVSDERKELFDSLPTDKNWFGFPCYQYQSFWHDHLQLVGLLSCQDHFQACDTDILIASYPKTGTTWLKALAYCVMKRSQFPDLNLHPLLTTNPHLLVPYLEYDFVYETSPDFNKVGHPRLLSTHLPYASLPTSVIDKGCKMVYVSRDAKDTFVSLYKFAKKLESSERTAISLDEAVEKFTKGISIQGPYWDHVLGFWRQSLENPKRVLFLWYEKMKENPKEVVRKLGEFLDCPFSDNEEAAGLMDEIVKLCSFENMSNLEVNKTGRQPHGLPNKAFFRQGKVGDSANVLSPEHAKLIDDITNDKLRGSDLIL